MELKLVKKSLKQAIKEDFRQLNNIQKKIDCSKYRKFYNFINKYDYKNKNICETSVRKECYLLVNSIVPHPYTDFEKIVSREILYQSLCAELYYVATTIEKTDFEYGSIHLTVIDKMNILKKCWIIIKKLYDCYYKDYDNYERKYSYEIRSIPMMSRVFNRNVLEIKKYMESRKDIDTRDFKQKGYDAIISFIGSLVAYALYIICLIVLIFLMGKCCSAVF